MDERSSIDGVNPGDRGARDAVFIQRIQGLDGIRAIAVLFVLGYHGRVPGFGGGYAGVDMFFVLSGFLITSLLLAEFRQNGQINIRFFWARRALRLFPALAVAIVLSLVIVTAQLRLLGFETETVMRTVTTVPFTLLYTTNIMRAIGFNGNGGLLAHTWSLSVEEQFYVLWPLLTMFVLKRRGQRSLGRLALVLFGASASVAAVAVMLGVPLRVVENLTFTRAFGMFLGCWIAVFIRAGVPSWLSRTFRSTMVPAAALAVVALIVLVGQFDDRWMFVLGLQTVVVATAAIILHVVSTQSGPFVRLMDCPPLQAIGQRSYGLYLYHYPLFLAVGAGRGLSPNLALGMVLTFAAAWLSFRYIEVPVLRLRRHFNSAATPPTERSM